MKTEPDAYRILDASLNRCSEGLRTIEEFTRFVCNDRARSATAKQLRHDLREAAESLDRTRLLSSRDTPGDVGTTIQTPAESHRENAPDVVRAAIARTQQSLRCLEEYGKTVDDSFGPLVETIRYHFYRFAADVELAMLSHNDRGQSRRQRLAAAQLYALVDAGANASVFQANMTSLADAGVDMFQLRDTDVDDRTLFERAILGSRLARSLDVLFIVNDRPDIALSAESDGVHVGQEELPAVAARKVLGRERLLGISTHNMNQVRQAVRDGADCIGCGPMFAGSTKTFDSYVGPSLIKQVVDSGLDIPAFAIGGIDAGNLSEVLDIGGTRIAVTGAISRAKDPAQSARELKQLLSKVTK